MWVMILDKLVIKKDNKGNDTVTRTIRMNGNTFDKVSSLAEKNDISFNSVINQIIEFGLEHLDEKN